MSNFFSYVNNFWHKRIAFDSNKTIGNHFSAIRMISFHIDGLYTANDVNRLSNLPSWAVAGTLYYALPKKNPRRITLPKKTKALKHNKKTQTKLKRVCQRFNVNEMHGLQLITLLEQQGIVIGD